MSKIIIIWFGILSFLVPFGSAFGLCISGGGGSHSEVRILLKNNQTFKHESAFATDLLDSSGNKVSDIQYELNTNLLEYQSICRKNDEWLGFGFAATGALPLLVKEPNASFETSNDKTSFKDVLINYYGVSGILDATIGSGIRSNSQVGFVATGEAGWELITGKYDYTYDGSVLQTDEMKNYSGFFLELFLGVKFNIFDNNKSLRSLLLGKTQRLYSYAEVNTEYVFGYSQVW